VIGSQRPARAAFRLPLGAYRAPTVRPWRLRSDPITILESPVTALWLVPVTRLDSPITEHRPPSSVVPAPVSCRNL